MSKKSNLFGPLGTFIQVKVKFDMERSFGRHGKGVSYFAELSFDPAIFEPGSGVNLSPKSFGLKLIGFDSDDLEHIENLGVSVARWEKAAIDGLCGFGAMDSWLEEGATDAQASYLEEAGYLDDLIDMEREFGLHFNPSKFATIHS